MNTPTVFVVDDDAAVREGTALLLEVAGLEQRCCDCAEALLATIGPESRGCLLLDINMPGMNGLELQEELVRRGICLPIIFLSAHGDIPSSVKAIKAGAMEFLVKPVSGAALIAQIQLALDADHRRHQEAAIQQNALSRLSGLTEREREILALALSGQSNKEIARHLGISYRTVETHRSHILLKTGATTLLELAQLAAAGGLSALPVHS
ncbi:DNA-binding response regulator [Denitratisoma sp. DHT3]|uniref:response regulator transcription factor n=1 Tax=Denitratisoma sp. DHT3 TaxID=1981880 RepID=UPI001198671E|nr:response regulator [Denitratisoma sp. DHT3]QDX82514.1 DNA-binding response regulator [Denitratisoma sp. DHT3]